VVAFLYRIATGIPGTVNRVQNAKVQAEIINSTTPPTAYGIMTTMDAATGTIRAPTGTDTAAMFAGMFVRPYPRQGGGIASGPVNDPLGTSTPPTSGPGDVLKSGYMAVQLNAASPAVVKGQAVGIFIGTASAGNPAGGVTGAAPGATVLAIPATFMGPADTNGITEIAYNL
jgi:hypothetical protein